MPGGVIRMSKPRKRYTTDFKAHVAFEACKEDRTLAQLSHEFGVSPEQICRWKKKLQSNGRLVFAEKPEKKRYEESAAPLYEEIGRLKIELDRLRKNN
jgi:transposase-like protein